MIRTLRTQPWFIKVFNWEYWPFNLLYGPIYLYWIWLMLRARSAFFFNTSNPLIRNGGFLLESKKEIYDLIPACYYPATLLFPAGTPVQQITDEMQSKGLTFPVIAKPDIGMRGLMVQKIGSVVELAAYASLSRVEFLVQEFVDYEQEAGIFYYRYPGEERGRISGIVGKEFLTVTGDGTSTIEMLLKKDSRYILQLDTLKETHAATLSEILPNNEQRLLVPYGNHCRGSKFIDISHLNSDTLEHAIDAICREIPEFYFGRLDIRYKNWEDLLAGKNLSIIELNGAGSEPTHIYDPAHSVFFAWKEIIRHWNILYRVSRLNHQRLQLPYMKFSSGIKMLRDNGAYVKSISVRIKQTA